MNGQPSQSASTLYAEVSCLAFNKQAAILITTEVRYRAVGQSGREGTPKEEEIG